MTLGEFLQTQTGTGTPWNCSHLSADWCMARGHPDFAAEWREIVDPGLCDATTERAGGLLLLWDQGIGDGLPVVTELQAGDIAVVGAAGIQAGAIWTGERWAIRAARGLHFLAANSVALIKAWRP